MCVSSLYRQFLSAAAIILAMSCAVLNVADAATEFLYVNVHEITRAPIGWLDFCATNPAECATTPTTRATSY